MLHELIVALSGYPGCLFVEKSECNFSVVHDIPFVHPSESAILDRMCFLVSQHQFIRKFVSENSKLTRAASSVLSPTLTRGGVGIVPSSGLYLRALSRGLEKVMEPYHKLLLNLEEDVLKDPHLTLTYIQKHLESYHLLFPAIVDLLNDVNEKRIRGCQVLDVVHKHMASGIPNVQRAMKTLMATCHSVMFKQMTSCLLYGFITDPYREFFIQERLKPTSGGRNLSEIVERDQVLGGEYFVQPDMLPVYIPTALAEKICFVGESIQLLESKEHKDADNKDANFFPNKDGFAKKLHELSTSDEFEYRNLETVIDEIRLCVAEQLWRLVVEKVGLKNHLNCIKDFYLLGRGELFQAFIDQATAILQQPATSTTEHNVNVAFQNAARSVLLFEDVAEDSLFDKFKFVITKSGDALPETNDLVEFYTKENTTVGWNRISLKYEAPWPLHILFSPPILEKYNAIFRFLLHIKRVQLELQHCWILQMQWKGHNYEDTNYPPAWNLRTLMSFVVDNLQYYLQVDVLETQFSVLTNKINSTKDFEAIKQAHEHFVISLLAQTFLSSKAIGQRVTDVLDLCMSFCTQFRAASSLTPSLTNTLVTSTQLSTFSVRVAELQKQFHRQASLLFQVLSNSHAYQTTPFVSQLLLRLDYNMFFSSGRL